MPGKRNRFKPVQAGGKPAAAVVCADSGGLETLRVLQAVYRVEDDAILAVLNNLLLMPVLLFETPPVLHAFINAATGNNFDLADLLIAHSARGHQCESVLTFNKKAAKFAGFELIK